MLCINAWHMLKNLITWIPLFNILCLSTVIYEVFSSLLNCMSFISLISFRIWSIIHQQFLSLCCVNSGKKVVSFAFFQVLKECISSSTMKSPKFGSVRWCIAYFVHQFCCFHFAHVIHFSCNRYKLENNGLVSGMCPNVVVSYCSYCFLCELIKGVRVDADASPQLLIR